jgi:hypothetical protein
MVDLESIYIGATAIAGGAVGSFITYLLARANLKVDLLQARLDYVFPPADVFQRNPGLLLSCQDLIPPPELYQACHTSEHVKNLPRSFSSPQHYLSELINREKACTLNMALVGEMPSVVKRLESMLTKRDLPNLFAEWHEWNDLLNDWVSSEIVMGRLVLDWNASEYPASTRKLELTVDPAGDFHVHLEHSNLFIPFSWSKRNDPETFKPVALSLATIFAWEDTGKLQKILTYLGGISWDLDEIKRLDAALLDEIQRYRQVVVRGILSNPGGSAIAVAPSLTLTIHGEKTMVLPVSLLDDDLIPSQKPVTIPAGAATTFAGATAAYVKDMDPIIVSLSGRPCSIEVTPITGGRSIHSRKRSFNPNSGTASKS